MTLMFTELVNSSLAGSNAAEEVEERLFHVHHKLLTDAVQAATGRELQWLGEGMLAGFQSSADAVQCAIAIQQSSRRQIEGFRLDLKIGLHFGELRHRDGGYFGNALSAVQQLCQRAKPGQIACSAAIVELLSARPTFSFNLIAESELRGMPSRSAIYEVVFEANDPAAMLNRTPFVGRESQVRRLAARLEEATNGRGSVMMLRGEPGIGKSRLLDEFADRAQHGGATVLRGACYDGDWQAPYGPFSEAVTEYARHADRAELSATLGKRASIVARIAPTLHDIMHDIPEPPRLEPEDERFRLFDAIAQFLVAASRNAPLVLMLDDLHWADRGVIGMLNHVARIVSSNPILVIGAYRDAEVNRKHPLSGALAAIARLRNYENLKLDGLSGDELASMLEIIGAQDAPDALTRALREATEGNPLFIRELLLHLREEGKILSGGRGWASKFSVEELGLPEGVRQVIGRRLARLSEDANRLLSVAAAFNGSFAFDVAAGAAGLDERAALAALDEAIDAQLLEPGALADTFNFTHALIRQTLYAQQNPARRVRLHRKIAEEMERAWGEQARHHAAEVAFHFHRASSAHGAERGADYAIAAADNAAAAFAHDDVAGFLRIALEMLAPSDSRRAPILSRLSFALTWSLDAEDALATARAAGALILTSQGDDAAADFYEQIARAMFNAGLTRAAWELAKEGLRFIGARRDIVWASLTEIDINRSEGEDPGNPGIMVDSQNGRRLAEVLWQVSHEQLDARNIELIHLSRAEILKDPAPSARIYMRSGNYSSARERWQREAVDCEMRGALARALRAWAGVARCHTALGEFAEATAALDRATAVSARMPNPSFGAMALQGARVEYCLALDEGWHQLEAQVRGELNVGPDVPLMAIFRALGPEGKWMLSGSYAYSAALYAYVGQPDLSLQHLSLVPDAIERGAGWGVNYLLTACMAVTTLWILNRTDHIDVIERNILKKVVEPDFHFPMNDGRLSLARLCALQGRFVEASQWFAKSREALEANGARSLRAISDYDEALMYLRRGLPGDQERALPCLDKALQQFRALRMNGWIRRVEQLAAMDTSACA